MALAVSTATLIPGRDSLDATQENIISALRRQEIIALSSVRGASVICILRAFDESCNVVASEGCIERSFERERT